MTGLAGFVIRQLPYRDFDRCPICKSFDPLTDEHVPQDELGGQIMTRTCADCNNKHGSLTEPWLARYFDDVIPNIKFSHEDVRGERAGGSMAFRQTSTGSFVLIMNAEIPTEVKAEALRTKQFGLSMPDPREDRWRIAALKHAYLAACINLGHIPDSQSANEARHDLLVARDFARHTRLPHSAIASSLVVGRAFERYEGIPPLALVAAQVGDDPSIQLLISLAGKIVVSWPFADLPPRLD